MMMGYDMIPIRLYDYDRWRQRLANKFGGAHVYIQHTRTEEFRVAFVLFDYTSTSTFLRSRLRDTHLSVVIDMLELAVHFRMCAKRHVQMRSMILFSFLFLHGSQSHCMYIHSHCPNFYHEIDLHFFHEHTIKLIYTSRKGIFPVPISFSHTLVTLQINCTVINNPT